MTRKNSFEHEDLVLCGNGKMFGPGNPQLPTDNMLMLDRITHISEEEGNYGKGLVLAELDIHPDLWFFECHFPGDPVMPGCLGLDALWQLLGFYMAWTGLEGRARALGVGELKFSGQILQTTKKVSYQIDVKRIVSRSLKLGIGDGIVIADGKEIYHAKDLRIGLFDSTDNF